MIEKLLGVLVASACACEGYEYPEQGRRVFDGKPDIYNRYPFVVSIELRGRRLCTGNLIAQHWVLTAAHCRHWSKVRYGDMTTTDRAKKTYSKIIRRIPHPGFRQLMNEELFHYIYNDIALMQIEGISLAAYGDLSALDYKSIQGVPIEFAGYGTTFFEAENYYKEAMKDEFRPLQLGKGVVASSCPDWYTGPVICVAPKCNKRYQQAMLGDSGGPLFYDGKIIGVLGVYSWEGDLSGFVPVSPFLTWISDTMKNITSI